MAQYAITGFTGDTSWATQEALDDVETRLRECGAAVHGIGVDSLAGMPAVIAKFVIEAVDDKEAETKAHETLIAAIGNGYGWSVSRMQPWREGFGVDPFGH